MKEKKKLMGKSQPEWRRDPLRSSLPDQLFGIFSKDSCLLNYSWGGGGARGQGEEVGWHCKTIEPQVKKQAKSNILHTNFCSQDGVQAQYLQSDTLLPPKSCPLTNIGKIQTRRKISSKCRSFGTLSWLLESCCDLYSMTPWGGGS